MRAGLLKADTSFTANKLYLDKLNKAELDASDQQLGLPLNLCLALLRDSDDNIRLKVPLEGNLNNPKVPAGKLIWQVLGKALAAAVRNVAMAFFPSGNHLGFDPVAFQPGSAELTPEGQDYLQKVGKKLATRPQVTIKLAGKATGIDWLGLKKRKMSPDTKPVDVANLKPADTERLLTLASSRVEAIRVYLAEQMKVDVKRLLISPPAIDPSPQAQPRAELSL